MNIIQVNSTIKLSKKVSVRKNKQKKHLHEILTPKEKTERCISVNRDKNACKNVLYFGKYIFFEHQLIHKEFTPKPKEKSNYKNKRNPRQKKEMVVSSR